MRFLVLVALASLAAACRSTGTISLEGLYERSLTGSFHPDGRPARLADVRSQLADDPSPRERTFGALLLLDSGDVSDLELAYLSAESADAEGFEAARPVMAQAIDRALYLQGYPQKYGTQLVPTADGAWELYSVDPKTTDADRRALGVPPLAEALARARTAE